MTKTGSFLSESIGRSSWNTMEPERERRTILMASRRDRMRSTHFGGPTMGMPGHVPDDATFARFSIFDGSSLRSRLATLIPRSKGRYRKANIRPNPCIRGRTNLGTSLGSSARTDFVLTLENRRRLTCKHITPKKSRQKSSAHETKEGEFVA